MPSQYMEHSDDRRGTCTRLVIMSYDDRHLGLDSTWCYLSSRTSIK